MTSLVGHSGAWTVQSHTTPIPWPAGTQAGDLAIWCALTTQQATINHPAGWSRAGDFEYYRREVQSYGSIDYPTVWYNHYYNRATLAHKVLTAADLAAGLPQDNKTSVRLVIIRDSSGVGAVRSGVPAVPARAGGGVVSFFTDVPPTDVTGLTLLGDPSYPLAASSANQAAQHRAYTGWAAVTVDGTSGGTGVMGKAVTVELKPPVAPSAPTVLSPADGTQVSAGVPLEVAWLHNPNVPGGYQDAYQLRVSIDGGDWVWYDPATGTTSTSEVIVTSTAQETSLAAALLVDGDPVAFQVLTREGVDGRWATSWSPARTVTPVTPPTMVLTGPPATVHNDLSPTVTFTATTPAGSVTGSRFRVLSGATVLHDATQDGPALSYTIPPLPGWTNGDTYTVQGWVRQTGGSWSPMVSRTFTLTWAAPPAPTLTATPDRHGIVLAFPDALAGDVLEIQRVDPGGTWAPVSTLTVDVDAPTVHDVLAPYGAEVAYRARALTVLDGRTLPSDTWTMTDPVVSTDRCAYLVDAASPLTRWIPAGWSDDSPRPHDHGPVVAYGIGDEKPHFTYGTYRGTSGTWAFLTYTAQELEQLLAFLLSRVTLRLRQGAEEEVDPDSRQVRTLDRGVVTFKVASAPVVSRLDTYPRVNRVVEVSWVETDPVAPVDVMACAPVVLSMEGANVEPGPAGTLLVTVDDPA